MSIYQFMASDKELEEYDNGIIVLSGNKLRNRKNFFITEEQELQAMRIRIEDDMSYASLYTNKKQCVYIEWYYTEKNAKVMLAYIKKHLEVAKEIELWNVWLNEKKKPRIKKCSLKELDIKRIKEIFGKESFVEPECLVVYR